MKKKLSDEEAALRFRLLNQQLTLTVLYEEDFIKKLGRSGLENMRNSILDEINWLKKNYNLNEK